MVAWVYFLLGVLTDTIFQLVGPFLSSHSKLKRIISGRRTSWKSLESLPPKTKKRIWAHAASLGEYQMLLPLLENLDSSYELEVHVSFFSPSGYENANLPDHWFKYYIQHDTTYHAKKFLQLLKPDLVIFAKYEFWLAHLQVLNLLQIPFIYWNTLLREHHFLTKWWSKPWRKELTQTYFWGCQNEKTQTFLHRYIQNSNTQLTGDVRFLQTAELKLIPTIFNTHQEQRWNSKKNIIWGSCWQPELDAFLKVLPQNTGKYRFIIAPHDVSEAHLKSIEKQIKYPTQRLSEWLNIEVPNAVVLVDGIGKLRFIYRYASFAVIGGGFTNALHNIIEPLSNFVPVMFGANNSKFPEAEMARDKNAALESKTPEEMALALNFLLFHENTDQMLAFHQLKAKEFFQENMPKMDEALVYIHKILTK